MASVILAEPWFGGSHRAWAEGLAAHSAHRVSIVGLTPSLWRWRLRAGAAPLAEAVRAKISEIGEPDVLLVSGLVDVAALLGHLRPSQDLPVITYMHESQLLYPTADGSPDSEATLRNWESWRASDQVWFNSHFHRDALVAALPGWAAAQPEPLDVDDVVGRFEVVPVGVVSPEGERAPRPTRGANPAPIIVWPHRWEPDKAPAVFARAVDKLVAQGLDFRLVLAGEDATGSTVKADIIGAHGPRIAAAGPFERSVYEQWLHHADIVVSCAEHEFFGIAVVEALMAGCHPVLPDALSYPELIPEVLHGASLYPVGSFGTRLADVVADLSSHRAATATLAAAMRRFDWSATITDYDERIASLVQHARTRSR